MGRPAPGLVLPVTTGLRPVQTQPYVTWNAVLMSNLSHSDSIMLEQKSAADAQPEIANRIDLARAGIPKTLAAIKRSAESA